MIILTRAALNNKEGQAIWLEKQLHWKRVRVLGIDGLYPLGKGKKQAVLIAVDLGCGQLVAIGQVNCSLLT